MDSSDPKSTPVPVVWEGDDDDVTAASSNALDYISSFTWSSLTGINVQLARKADGKFLGVFNATNVPIKYFKVFQVISKLAMMVRADQKIGEPAPPILGEDLYLRLIKNIIIHGVDRMDRTKKGTRSLFGEVMTFSLTNNQVPLLTTKLVRWRSIVEELLWMIRGSTSSVDLATRKVHIWDANGSREALDAAGLRDNEVGDLGPVYGFQWRHYGAEYKDMHADYTGQGVDQLKECIRTIKENPSSRRNLMCSWNVKDLPKMALPPCHVLCQFYVDENGLSCMLYQRSCDVGLGVPFNIASYSFLTHMIAHVCGLKAHKFVYAMGDVHIYSDHLEKLAEQTTRTPRAFPTVHLNQDVTDIDKFTFEDFKLEGYDPHPEIKLPMSV